MVFVIFFTRKDQTNQKILQKSNKVAANTKFPSCFFPVSHGPCQTPPKAKRCRKPPTETWTISHQAQEAIPIRWELTSWAKLASQQQMGCWNDYFSIPNEEQEKYLDGGLFNHPGINSFEPYPGEWIRKQTNHPIECTNHAALGVNALTNIIETIHPHE